MRSPTAGRRLVPLAVVFLAVGLSTAMASPFLALFLTEAVRADGVRTAAFLVAAPVSTVVVTTLVGKVSDGLRSRQGLLAGAALAGGIGAAVTASVRDYWVLLAVAVTVTAGAGAVMPQLFAYARESLGDSGRVALAISSLRSLFSLAWVAGPPLAAVLLHVGGFALVYGASSAMYAVAAVVVLVGLDDARPDARAAPVAAPASVGASGGPSGGSSVRARGAVAGVGPAGEAGTAPASRMLVGATVLVFVLSRCAGTLSVQGLPLFTTRVIGGGVTDAGLVLGLCAALEIPLMIGFGVASARFPLHRLLVAGSTCGLAYLTLASLATSTWELAAGQVLNAASIAAMTGLGITYVQDLLPRQPGRASTLFTNTFASGNVLAGPVLGAAQQVGYRMPFVVGAAVSALALVLLMIARPRRAAGRPIVPVDGP